VFEWAWGRSFDWSVVRAPLVTAAAVLAAIVVGGSVRLALAPTDRPSLRMAALNRPVDLFGPGEMTRIAEGRVSADERMRLTVKLTRLHDWFLEGSRREARAGARLIAWPEQNLLIFKEDEPAFITRAQRLAAAEGVYLAIGLGTVSAGAALPFENRMILIDPAGAIVVSYLKSHAVVGWEASIMKPGDGRVPLWDFSRQLQTGRLSATQESLVLTHLEKIERARPGAAASVERSRHMVSALTVGKVAPDITGTDLDGVEFRAHPQVELGWIHRAGFSTHHR